jgi:hypothetical protein
VIPKMRGRRIVAGALVVLVAVALVVGSLFLFADEAGENGTVEPDQSASLPTTDPTGGSTPEADPNERTWGSIRLVVETEAEGEDRVKVFFVSDENDEAAVLDDATTCVDDFLAEDYASVSCYGFDSGKAFKTSAPDPETGEMFLICWRAFQSASQEDSSSGVAEDKDYEERGCP